MTEVSAFDAAAINRHAIELEEKLGQAEAEIGRLNLLLTKQREHASKAIELVGARRMEWRRLQGELVQLAEAAAGDDNQAVIDALKARIRDFWA